jgi:Major Facilitator Superfamily
MESRPGTHRLLGKLYLHCLNILLGLFMGGTTFPWSSHNIIVSLVLGFVGWAAFHVYEASRACKNPSMPPRLFTNRTSLVGFMLAFDSAILLEWIVYYLPIYFQAVLGTSPLGSGVDILPLNVFLIPFAILAGGLLTKFGKYRPIYLTGFAFMAIGVGLFSILTSSSHRAAWLCFQILAALGLGFVMTTILPSIQASLPESDVGSATGTYAFLRSFGFVWGVTVPSIVFNNQFDRYIGQISDAAMRARLANGQAYGYATGGFISSLPDSVQTEVVNVYTAALKTVWHVATAFSLFGFLAVFMMKHVELRTELQTEYGLDEGKKQGNEELVAEEGSREGIEKRVKN